MKFTIPKANPNPTAFDIKPLYGMSPEAAAGMEDRIEWRLSNAEYFSFLFKPKNPNIVEQFIPPPLKLVPGTPLLSIFIQQNNLNGGEGNNALNKGYCESILGAFVSYNGQTGYYPIAIHIESDLGAILGREMFGTAKKVANVAYEKNGNHFSFKVERRGIVIAEASGEIGADEVDPRAVEGVAKSPNWHIHQTIATTKDKTHYAVPPRLVQMQTGIDKIHSARNCDNVSLVFHESPFDPICLMQPEEIYGVSYMNADTFIDNTQTLEELDDEAMLPFLFSKLDPF